MIFQGQEFLEDEWFRDDVPLDWERLDTQGGMTLLYRDLIRLRRNLDGRSAGLTGGHVRVHHTNNTDKVLAYHRWKDGGPGDDVVIVVNFADRRIEGYQVGLPHQGHWDVAFDSDARVYHDSYEGSGAPYVEATAAAIDGMSAAASISLAPYSAVILVRREG